MRFDIAAAVAAAPAGEPGERTFAFIDGDTGAAEFGRDLPLRQGKMLAAKRIDFRLRRIRNVFCRLAIRAAHGRTCGRV